MSSTAPKQNTSLHLSITVDVPLEHAFEVFTERFDEIKPRHHNLLNVPIERTVLDARTGGTVYDLGEDGSTCTWARVLACDPPNLLVISWDITPQWELETDLAHTSEVEFRFLAETPRRTRVELEHRHLDRHGSGWERFTALDKDNGWPLYLDRFRAAVETAPSRA